MKQIYIGFQISAFLIVSSFVGEFSATPLPLDEPETTSNGTVIVNPEPSTNSTSYHGKDCPLEQDGQDLEHPTATCRCICFSNTSCSYLCQEEVEEGIATFSRILFGSLIGNQKYLE